MMIMIIEIIMALQNILLWLVVVLVWILSTVAVVNVVAVDNSGCRCHEK